MSVVCLLRFYSILVLFTCSHPHPQSEKKKIPHCVAGENADLYTRFQEIITIQRFA